MTIAWATRSTLNFILGLVTGLVLALIFAGYANIKTTVPYYAREKTMVKTTLKRPDEILKEIFTHDWHDVFNKESQRKDVRGIIFEDNHVHQDDDNVARNLRNKVKILIWVMTSPDNLDKKAVHVKKTWGKRVDKLLFFSSENNSSFPVVGLNVSEGREHLTGKTMQAFNYIYDHHFNDADWFMKADDDTYVILENLRYFLAGHDTNKPIYFGHHFKTIVKQGYFSGGAGYVLSKEALRRFATVARNGSVSCRQDGGAEDAEIGHCMERLGVKTGNSTDRLGRSRFHCFNPETHLHGGYPDWYYQYDANGARMGVDSISDYAITFHYVSPKEMYDLEFFTYHLRPYGIQSGNQDLNQK
ncbi:hypothetical protein CHS0354_010115 [Potamilus streckersoni]|uniref:Glycoprotein-N-acetylgalactosamine 3-beta-galactosyltransferase 1 n=1 Tax=Potamilus streckersoni TaxID=2493646 RepID=A0AAE0RSK5_9BIVA|nr:hypothetical protein CHS0354_010115 [Potamilus streckersoni]